MRLSRRDVETLLDRVFAPVPDEAPALDEIEVESVVQLVRDREQMLLEIARFTAELRSQAAFGSVGIDYVVNRLDRIYEDGGGRDS